MHLPLFAMTYKPQNIRNHKRPDHPKHLPPKDQRDREARGEGGTGQKGKEAPDPMKSDVGRPEPVKENA